MSTFIIIAILCLGGLIGFGLYYLHTRLTELAKSKEEDKSFLMLQNQLNEFTKQVNEQMRDSNKLVQNHSLQSAKIVKEVTEKLTELGETNKQVVGFATQLQSLENILKNPKQRGILGEYMLETLLSNVLPPNQYQMQYSFSNGLMVDAAVFLRDKVIPIDAKFSLEKYNKIMDEKDKKRREDLEKEFKQDLKNRIDETSKYILPEENTTEFAIMFIPAEGIFYNLLIYKVGALELNANDLVEYAFKKRVMIVSPTSFFAYLQTVIQGLKALKVEESVQEVIKQVGLLSKHLVAYDSYMQKLGGHLGTTVGAYNNAYKEFNKINKDVTKISGETNELTPMQIERPVQE